MRITLKLFQQGAVSQPFGFARMLPGQVIVALDGVNPSQAHMRGRVLRGKFNCFQEASDGRFRPAAKVRKGSKSKVRAGIRGVQLEKRHLFPNCRIDL